MEGCAHVSRPKRPQHPVKGVWGETQADDEGGSIMAAIVAQFLTAIDMESTYAVKKSLTTTQGVIVSSGETE